MSFFQILKLTFWLSCQSFLHKVQTGLNWIELQFLFDMPKNIISQIMEKLCVSNNCFSSAYLYFQYGFQTEKLSFREISTPLNQSVFLSWWAISAYLLLPIIIKLIVNFNTRRLLKEKQSLEKVVSQRTREIIKQKEEIIRQRDELKRKSLELENALNAISEQNKKLELLNATKDKFFTIVAHDLKSPLNSLSGFSDLLTKYTDALTVEEIKTVSHDLHKAVKNTFHLAENLLTWARAQMNGLNYFPKPIPINEVISQTIELLDTSIQNKMIKVHTSLTPDLITYADEDHIKFVLRNFLSNAIKFTRQGKGVIQLSSYNDNGIIVVEVQDNGIGMNKHQLKNIFCIDSKSSTTGTAGEKGTGLGLLLCKEFITQNGGSIYVRSEEGKGSVFGFRLLATKAEIATV